MTASLHSPLAHLQEEMRATDGPLRLREIASLGQLDLRADAAARPPLEQVLGVELPCRPNHWEEGPPDVFWLGPDEWLVVGAEDLTQELGADLRAAADPWAAIVDVSDQRTVLELTGSAAIDILSSGCPIDLHPRAFGPGQCAQTLFGRAGVLISRDEREDCFRLFVRSSFASYAAERLLDAIRR